ncbi:MAG: hypothetical protein OXI76_08095, partial [Gemmatimonadota bacterium]|nr:hypothetical protein [Gemmatimonadota bacterium]
RCTTFDGHNCRILDGRQHHARVDPDLNVEPHLGHFETGNGPTTRASIRTVTAILFLGRSRR